MNRIVSHINEWTWLNEARHFNISKRTPKRKRRLLKVNSQNLSLIQPIHYVSARPPPASIASCVFHYHANWSNKIHSDLYHHHHPTTSRHEHTHQSTLTWICASVCDVLIQFFYKQMQTDQTILWQILWFPLGIGGDSERCWLADHGLGPTQSVV